MDKKNRTSPVFYCLSPLLVFFLINYLVSLGFITYAVISENIALNSSGALEKLLDFSDRYIFEIEACSYVITFCFAYFIKYRKFEKKRFDDRFLNGLEFKDVLLAIICGVGIYLITDIVIVILNGIFNLESVLTEHNQVVSSVLTDNIIKDIILLGLLAPITEEFLFRGLIFNRIRLFTEEKTAIIISALIFAFMHIGTFIQIGYAFALGYALAYSYTKFENIKIPIVIHMSFNLTNCLYYIPGLDALLNTKIGYLIYYALGITAIVYAIEKLRKRNKPLTWESLRMKPEDMLEPW